VSASAQQTPAHAVVLREGKPRDEVQNETRTIFVKWQDSMETPIAALHG
jgi:hypothetical protein